MHNDRQFVILKIDCWTHNHDKTDTKHGMLVVMSCTVVNAYMHMHAWSWAHTQLIFPLSPMVFQIKGSKVLDFVDKFLLVFCIYICIANLSIYTTLTACFWFCTSRHQYITLQRFILSTITHTHTAKQSLCINAHIYPVGWVTCIPLQVIKVSLL